MFLVFMLKMIKFMMIKKYKIIKIFEQKLVIYLQQINLNYINKKVQIFSQIKINLK